MKHRLAVLPLCIALAIALSCGDDEQGPSGPGTDPQASVLIANSGSTNSISLSWTTCGSSDFAEYRIYRSLTAGIQQNPGQATVIQVVSTVTDTTLTDAGLDWNTLYYYAIQTFDTEQLSSWSNEASATTPDSGGSGNALTCYEVQGQQPSSPYEGQTVSVTGIVTVGEGEYYGTYAAMADAGGGPWSGLILYGNDVVGISRGDSITITGPIVEYYGLTELQYPTSIVVHSTGHSLPDPEVLTTSEVYQPSTAEQWEGVLVRVNDAIVTSAPDQYGQWMVDDGSGDAMVDDLGDYSYNPVVGDTLDYIIGVLNYSYDEYKIEPRDDGDIQGGGGGGDVLTCYQVQGQQSSSPYNGQTVSVTGIVTSGAGEYSDTYAAMADQGGGPWSGLILYGNDVVGISRGDSITITGLVDEYYGLTELKFPTSIVVHSTGHPLPAAEVVTTDEVYQAATAEQWEGVLVRVEDVTVTSAPNQYGEWTVDDGSGDAVINDLGSYTYTPQVGNFLSSITGVLNYSYDEYKIEPRDDGDIVE
jgi:predicted extracellular nuclease